jgi:hypothetical protein
MFRHIVLYKVRQDLGEPACERLEALIRSLPARAPGVVALDAGPNVGPDGFTKGFDWGFCMSFADRAARDTYMRDPYHQDVAAEIEGLIDDLVVLGIES